jgi:ATP-dependent RNA helicase SUPV3L1/SUV3
MPRPGALSAPLQRPHAWGECAAAGYRACGRIAVRFDLVEKLADALGADAQPDDAMLARLIGRPARDLAGVLNALGYRRAEEEGAVRWRKPARKRRHPRPAPTDNAFSALAELLPTDSAPPRRSRTKQA